MPTLNNLLAAHRRNGLRRQIDRTKILHAVQPPAIQPMTEAQTAEVLAYQYRRDYTKPVTSTPLLGEITLETMAQATRDHAKYLATAGKTISSVCASCGRTCKLSERMVPSAFDETALICMECA